MCSIEVPTIVYSNVDSNMPDVEEFKQELKDVEIEENKLYLDIEAAKSIDDCLLTETSKKEEQFKCFDNARENLIKEEDQFKHEDVQILDVSMISTNIGEVDDIFEELLPTWDKKNGSYISHYAETQIDKEININLVDNETAENTNDLVLSKSNTLPVSVPMTTSSANIHTKKALPKVESAIHHNTHVAIKKYITYSASNNGNEKDESVTSENEGENVESEVLVGRATSNIKACCESQIVSKPLCELYIPLKRYKTLLALRHSYCEKDEDKRVSMYTDAGENVGSEVLDDMTCVDRAISNTKASHEKGSQILSKPLRKLYIPLTRYKTLSDLKQSYWKNDKNEWVPSYTDAVSSNLYSESMDSAGQTYTKTRPVAISGTNPDLVIRLKRYATRDRSRKKYCEDEEALSDTDMVEKRNTAPKKLKKTSNHMYLDHDYFINYNKSKKRTNKNNRADDNDENVPGPDFYDVPEMLVILKDYPKRMSSKKRAQLTVPKGVLGVRPSVLDGLGIYALTKIPEGVWLGPYEGKTLQIGLAWRLDQGKLLDLSDDQNSNYMRYINNTENDTENNLLAFQTNGKLYYKTCKEIDRNDQLLVYFDNICSNDTIGSYFEPRQGEIPEYHCCKKCNVGLSTEELVLKHQLQCRFHVLQSIDISLDEVIRCQSCTRIFKLHRDLDRHQRRCILRNDPSRKRGHRVKKFACDKCPYTTHGRSLLLRHGLIHNKSNYPVYNCYDCNYKTYYKDQLVQHAKAKHCGGTGVTVRACYVCVHCSKMYRKKDSLVDHIIGHHPEFIDTVTCKIHECPHCNFKTSKSDHLERHLASHTKEKKYKCDVCEYKANTPGMLHRHVMIHRQRKDYVCPGCGFEFSSKSAIGDHIVRHHYDDKNLLEMISNRIHHCRHCNYRSLFLADVKRHEESHRRGTI